MVPKRLPHVKIPRIQDFNVVSKLYTTKLTNLQLSTAIEALDYIIKYMKFLNVNNLHFAGADLELDRVYDARMKLYEVQGLMRE